MSEEQQLHALFNFIKKSCEVSIMIFNEQIKKDLNKGFQDCCVAVFNSLKELGFDSHTSEISIKVAMTQVLKDHGYDKPIFKQSGF